MGTRGNHLPKSLCYIRPEIQYLGHCNLINWLVLGEDRNLLRLNLSRFRTHVESPFLTSSKINQSSRLFSSMRVSPGSLLTKYHGVAPTEHTAKFAPPSLLLASILRI
ncbi:hypothetical protein V6Z79_003138 [Aspergillus fumigatus]